MSEHLEDFELFEKLSSALEDPYIDRMKVKAQAIAQKLNNGELDKDDARAAIADLNMDWIYQHRMVTASGVLWGESEEQDALQCITVAGKEMISVGFALDPERIVLNDEFINGHEKAVYAFLIKNSQGDDVYSVAAMHFDDVEHIEYPFPSPELRDQRFLYHSPKYAQAIDRAVFNARSTTDKIRELSEILTFDRDPGDADDQEEILDLQSYLENTMDLDRELPFRLAYLGRVAIMTSNTEATIINAEIPVQGLAAIKRVVMLRQDLYSTKQQGLERYSPYLDVHLYGQNRYDTTIRMMVPFSSILYAESIRDEA